MPACASRPGAMPKVIASALASCGTAVPACVAVVAVGQLVDAARGVEQGRVDALLEVGRLARPRRRVGLPRRGRRVARIAPGEVARHPCRVGQRLVVDRVVGGHGAELAAVVEVPVASRTCRVIEQATWSDPRAPGCRRARSSSSRTATRRTARRPSTGSTTPGRGRSTSSSSSSRTRPSAGRRVQLPMWPKIDPSAAWVAPNAAMVLLM